MNATAGVVATYNGAMINALFYATSGGRTAHSEDVFSAAAPYLRSVWDAPPGQELPSTAALLDDLKTEAWTGAYSNWHSYHRWSYTWTMAQMSCVIGDFANKPVGSVTAINVLGRSETGRVTRIEYVTQQGTFTDSSGAIRSSLAYISLSGVPTMLNSNLFVVERLTSSTGALTGYRVYGGGNGHGAGLAQTGAVGMARAGHTYDQILKKTTRGSRWSRRWARAATGASPAPPRSPTRTTARRRDAASGLLNGDGLNCGFGRAPGCAGVGLRLRNAANNAA